MCIICKGEDLTGLEDFCVSYCLNITEIPNIEGLQTLNCFWLNIT